MNKKDRGLTRTCFNISLCDPYGGLGLLMHLDGYLNLDEAFEPFRENTSRTKVYPDDLVNYHKEWDGILQKSIQKFEKVYQPLIDLVSEGVQLELQKILLGEKEMDSILNLYYKR